MRSRGNRYTPDDDARIIATRGDRQALMTLAKRLGRSYPGVQARHFKLRQMLNDFGPRRVNVVSCGAVFARPAWFDEDVSALSRSGR